MTTVIMLWLAFAAGSLALVLRMQKLGARVAAALNLENWDRATASKVFYRGVINEPESARDVIRSYRTEVGLYLAISACVAFWLLGFPALIFIAIVGIVAALTKPLDCAML